MSDRRDLVLLSVGSAVSNVGWSMIMLLVPLLTLRFGAGVSGLGVIVAGAALLPLVLAVPIGRVVDRTGARRVMIAGFAGTTLALVPVAVAPSLTTLVVAFVIVSALQNAFIIGAQALIAQLGAAGRSREAAYGWWTTAMAAGQVVGPPLAGVILDVAGPGPAFTVVAVVAGLAFALALAIRTRGNVETLVPPLRLAAGLALVRQRAVGLAVLTSTAAVWAMTVHVTFIPVHLGSLSMSATTIGALLSLKSVAAVIVRPIMPQLIALLGGRDRTVTYTLVALSVSLGGVVLHPSPVVIAAFMVLFGLGHGLSQPISMVMVADSVEPRARGVAMGVRLMLNRLSQVLAPVALTVVAERAGLVSMVVVHAVLVGVAAVVLLTWTRRGRDAAG